MVCGVRSTYSLTHGASVHCTGTMYLVLVRGTRYVYYVQVRGTSTEYEVLVRGTRYEVLVHIVLRQYYEMSLRNAYHMYIVHMYYYVQVLCTCTWYTCTYYLLPVHRYICTYVRELDDDTFGAQGELRCACSCALLQRTSTCCCCCCCSLSLLRCIEIV